MLTARCLSLVIIFLIIIPFSNTLLSQTKDITSHSIIICEEPGCGFATYAFDSTQVPLDYSNHRMAMHDKETTIESYKLLKRYQSYSPGIPEIRKIHCPLCGNFVEWSKDTKELIFNLNLHTSLVHNMKIQEDELKQLIE
jgi:hypothetical protein